VAAATSTGEMKVMSIWRVEMVPLISGRSCRFWGGSCNRETCGRNGSIWCGIAQRYLGESVLVVSAIV
jgi:hypothetical protein